MTENQVYPMSADLFDTSSNSSSNPLKYDLYLFGLGQSNSNSSSALFDVSPTQPLAVTISTNVNSNSNNNNNLQSVGSAGSSSGSSTSSVSSGSSSGGGGGGGGGVGTVGGSNVMLSTTAITIPRSNNPNQSHHHNSYQSDELNRHLHRQLPYHHHISPSALHLHLPQTMSSQQQQQQQQQQQHQQHQQQQQQQQARLMADFADYGLEALDTSSLSPTLLQDVSLSAASPLHNALSCVISNGGNISTGFYAQDASPIGGHHNHIGSSGSNITSTLLSAGSGGGVGGANDDLNNSLMYEVQGTTNSNTMWSDIGSAIVATKHEPFSLEDDYIFPIDKTEIQAAGLPDINDDSFFEVIGNIEDLLPPATTATPTTSTTTGGNNNNNTNGGFLFSTPSTNNLQQQQQQNSPQASPGDPPMELLQQHQQQQLQQQQQQQQLSQLQTQQQQQQHQLQHSNSAGGAIHHSHHSHHHHSSSSPYEIYHSTPNKQHQLSSSNSNNTNNTFSPGSQSSHSPLQLNSITPPPHANRSQFQQHLVKSRNIQQQGFSMSPDRSASRLGQSVPGGTHILLSGNALSPSSGSSGFGGSSTSGGSVRKSFNYQSTGDASISRLSSSAPTHLGIDHVWMRREPRPHLLSTGSLAEAESFSSLSTASVLSPDGVDLSQDDDDDASTDYNSDNYDDFSSDGSDNEDDGRTSTPNQLSSSKGKERYFWQYNVQAKGPKGKRLVFTSKLEDPHVLNEVTDPVFSPNCTVRGIKHSGKARKGDGNDLTPNPRKLHSIGKELDKLSRTINDMTPVAELPFNVRPKSRKEKNKLASRACRLKKKAQHEANKIKLFGLEIEHKRLLTGIAELKQVMALKYRNQNLGESNQEVDKQIERLYATATSGLRIAGGTTDFVNKVLENIKSGISNGGLEELRNS